MPNVMDVSVLNRPSKPKKQDELSLLLGQKIDQVRRLSNAIQALENVSAQCGDDEGLEYIRVYAEERVEELRKVMKREIHSY